MYKVISNFITEEEQQYIKNFVNEKIKQLDNKLPLYTENEQMFFAHENNFEGILNRKTESILFFYSNDDIKENKKLTEITHRIQDAFDIPHGNPNTYFNWVVSLSPNGTEVPAHVDPLEDELIRTKKIFRMNLIIQNAKRGGNFDLLGKDGWVTADIPDRAVMGFDASDITHRITKNLSGTTRINFSIDAVIDR